LHQLPADEPCSAGNHYAHTLSPSCSSAIRLVSLRDCASMCFECDRDVRPVQ